MTEETANNTNNNTKGGEKTMIEQTETAKENEIKQNDIKNNALKLPIKQLNKKEPANMETEENIFTEYLTNNEFIQEKDFAKEIERLKLSNDKNFLKIAKVIITYQEKYHFDNNWKNMYQHLLDLENVQIKRTQADKYIAVYKYCYEKFKKNQTTENMLKLGIEKLYLISMLEDKAKQEKLEEFVTVKKLSVKELSELIKLQNKTSKILELSEEFNNMFKKENEDKKEE